MRRRILAAATVLTVLVARAAARAAEQEIGGDANYERTVVTGRG
jgi:hypothetical protein